MYDRYDAAFVASDSFAAPDGQSVRDAGPGRSTRRPTPSASGPSRPARSHELLFVANSRSVRPQGSWTTSPEPTHDLAVYGTGWREDLIEPRFVRGDGIPNAEVGHYYSSAAIVLNDHWSDMRA